MLFNMSHLKQACWVFLFAGIVFSSCKKEDLQSQSGAPVFYAKGTLNGNFFNINAGVNNYYMYSSYTSDANDVYEFIGNLKEENCSASCPSSMTVRIRDYATHTSSATIIDTSLAAGFYDFVVPLGTNDIAFTPQIYADSVTSYAWSFGDNGNSTLPNPVHTYATAGIYTACLTVNATHNSFNCISTICDTVFVGTPRVIIPSITDSILIGDSLQFNSHHVGGTAPFTYRWRFGDATESTLPNPTHSYNTPGVYTATLYITDANSITEQRSQMINSPLADSCTVNFTWQQQSTTSATDFSKVVIEWTDASGNVYTSANSQQPSTSTFEIVSVENYDGNENHQATKKVHMRVNCTLYNGANTLLLQNAEIVFAVAHP